MTTEQCKREGRREIYASWEPETILRGAKFIAMKKRFGRSYKERRREMQYLDKQTVV
jgi:hypothetical protein